MKWLNPGWWLAVIAFLGALYGYHWWQVNSAYNRGQSDLKAEIERANAASTIRRLDQIGAISNADTQKRKEQAIRDAATAADLDRLRDALNRRAEAPTACKPDGTNERIAGALWQSAELVAESARLTESAATQIEGLQDYIKRVCQ